MRGRALLFLVVLAAGCNAAPPGDGDGGSGGDGGGCNIDEVLARPAYGCTASACHGGYAAGINLVDPGHLEALLTGRSQAAACNGRRYIDPKSPSSSLLLEALDPARYRAGTTCISPMPLGGAPISTSDLACVERWINDEVAAGHADVPGYRDDFAPSDPLSYARKVKTLTTGGALSDEEYKAIAADPGGFPARVKGWVQSPEGQDRLARFLALELEQHVPGGLAAVQEALRMGGGGGSLRDGRIVDNLRDSFLRTAKANLGRGAPLTDLFTTNEWQVTTALLAYIAWFDRTAAEQAETFRVFFNPPSYFADPKNQRVVNGVNMVVTVIDGVEYLDRAAPILAAQKGLDDSMLTTPGARLANRSWRASDLMGAPVTILAPAGQRDADGDPNDRKERCSYNQLGARGYIPLDGRGMLETLLGRMPCKPAGFVAFEARNLLLHDSDYSDWRTVRFVDAAGAKTIPFYDVEALRAAAGQVLLHRPVEGFAGTPAFLTTWPTNADNQFRVTTNQALIAALGARIAQGDPVPSPPAIGLDPVHTREPACLDCHRLLDPMRTHFAWSMTTDYFPWEAGAGPRQDGAFAFAGYSATAPPGVHGVAALGAALASHPKLAAAWVQKLCRYANSQECSEADPEFARLAGAFAASRFDLSSLAADILASPLVTAARYTDDYDSRPVLVSITRRNHLCAMLAARTGVADICARPTVVGLLASLPDDTVARGVPRTQGPALTSPLHQKTMVRFCEALAKIAVGGGALFKPSQADAAIARLVSDLMVIPDSAPRAAATRAALRAHFDAVCAANGGGANCSGAQANEALQSTFVLACTSPDFLGVGL